MVLLYGLDIKVAGSLSVAISLPTMRIAFARYKPRPGLQSPTRQRPLRAWLTTGSIACALILGIVPNLVLLPPLPCFLLISGIQLWRHLAEGSEADHLRRSGATLGWQTHSHPDHDRSRWVSRLVRRPDSRPVCGRPAECRTGTSTVGFVKLVVGTIGSFSAFISSAISLES